MIKSNSHIKYARALHKVALQAGVEQRVLHDLENLSLLFANPKFSTEISKIAFLQKNKLEKVLKETFKGALAELTLNLLILLARARKLVLLPRVYDAYTKLYHEHKHVEELKICTARKLSAEEEQLYIDKLQQKLDKPISVKFIANPALIGGIQIYSKGYVTDYSVKNYLERLKKHLLEN
jgi:F-type H+-transporting ATPase subunit delta